jgi:competence protein ComEC
MLGILLAGPAAAPSLCLLFIACVYFFSRRRRYAACLLLLLAAMGWLRAIWAAEAPIPPLRRHWQPMAIRAANCTVRNYSSGRRVNGFARLESMGDCGGKWGQQIYYNLALDERLPVPHRGQLLRIRAAVHSTANSRVPFERYLRETGVRSRIGPGRVVTVESGSPWAEMLARARESSARALLLGMVPEDPAGHIYGAMLLGNRSNLTAGEKDTYSRSGIAHLFAISGLHIGAIAAFLGAATGGLPLPRPILLALRLLLLGSFVAMTGASPSAFRALAMVTSLWAAPLFFRRASAMASLFFSASLTLLIRPMDLYATGFQFSYAVVYAILSYGLPLGRCLRLLLIPPQPLFSPLQPALSYGRRAAAACVDAAAISFAATIPLIPLSIFHFQTFSIGGIFLNPLVIPLAEVAIVCGFGSVCCGFFHGAAGCQLLNAIAHPILGAIHGLAGAVGSLPWVQSRPQSVAMAPLLLWTAALCAALHSCRVRPSLRLLLPLAVALAPLPLLPAA